MTIPEQFESPDFQKLRETSQTFYLFGEHISKSKAPLLHNTTFQSVGLNNWEYKLYEGSDFQNFNEKFSNENLIGSAITMPNKVEGIKNVDFLDSIGKGCGSINTIYTKIDPQNNKKVKVGTNTDTVGIKESFLQNYPKETEILSKSPGLIYGGGGACRSAVFALYNLLKVPKIYIINRFAEEVEQVKQSMISNGFKGEIIHVSTPEQAKTLELPKLVVLTVPNFPPTTKEEIQARSTLDVFLKQDEPGIVLEMCYHPIIETTLYNDFLNSNWKVISGVEAMIYQGIAQQILWTGFSIDEIPTKRIIESLYKTIKEESKSI
ncbi:hypothetical protein BN7_3044 [Wickerhamomyces ciferrii]|uniref:Shikimate dehydrogenase substrate binding N-terminal domain-containing protein n=1 Tax=Wickerhamomyces ciferrii (strain ATCC 14091 / BCRC 22168 / CBS 111 / JCM 3599 / NBRC 0793 / NRRL Y-1031 F-60-10) TaxID=1206466 RepID=K0KPY6_WICCF|nr:uncharacterized protein BN7_3044 [Wickerhamomyces ciferrii]CCH43494.1 hypothetical protein BN7_3044 [Wickerhamomyces ciferrii]